MLGILSDAHGNAAGFAKGMNTLKRLGVDRFVFLGDAVGYIPSWAVVDQLYRLRDQFTFVRGNHEDMVLREGHGLADDDNEAVYAHRRLRQEGDERYRSFIATWPDTAVLGLRCGSALFVHGSPSDPQNGYIYPDTDLDVFEAMESFVFCGHTHRPFIRTQGSTTYVNVGSCGLPRDHGRYGSVALFDDEESCVRILRYDISKETSEFLADCGPIHPSVRQLFDRRADELIGEVVHG